MNPTLTLLPSPALAPAREVSIRNNAAFNGDDDYQLELLAAQLTSFGHPQFDLMQNLVTLGLHGITAKIA